MNQNGNNKKTRHDVLRVWYRLEMLAGLSWRHHFADVLVASLRDLVPALGECGESEQLFAFKRAFRDDRCWLNSPSCVRTLAYVSACVCAFTTTTSERSIYFRRRLDRTDGVLQTQTRAYIQLNYHHPSTPIIISIDGRRRRTNPICDGAVRIFAHQQTTAQYRKNEINNRWRRTGGHTPKIYKYPRYGTNTHTQYTYVGRKQNACTSFGWRACLKMFTSMVVAVRWCWWRLRYIAHIYPHNTHTCDVFKWLCRDNDDAPRVCVSHVATVHIVLIAAG